MQLNLSKVSNPVIGVFRAVGMWPGEKFNFFYWIYGILNMSTFSFLFTLTMMIQLIAFTELDQLTETMYMALTEFALCFKILNFLFRLRSMQSLLQMVRSFELKSVAEEQHFNKRLKFLYTLLMLDFWMTNVAHLFTQIKVLLDSRRLLAFPAWHPFDWIDNTRNYWFIFVYQLIGMSITSNVQVVIGMYSNLMFYMISTQIEILSMRLRSIGYKKSKQISSDQDNKLNSIREENEITVTLKDCVKAHHSIIE